MEAKIFNLTGRMGSGKSTVSDNFAERGAIILDADKIVTKSQQPGQPVLLGMVAILGEGILTPDGELDRKAAAELIFSDRERKQAIEELIHPHVWGEIHAGIHRAQPDDTVILDVPLLSQTRPGGIPTKGTIVVDTETEIAVQRLMLYRDYSEEEARKRLDQQTSREKILAIADYVITNNGTPEELLPQLDDAWSWTNSRP